MDEKVPAVRRRRYVCNERIVQAVVGIPIMLGRDFDDRDVASTASVMIVNETFARHYFGDANPVGRRIGLAPGVFDVEIVQAPVDPAALGCRSTRVQFAGSHQVACAGHSITLRASAVKRRTASVIQSDVVKVVCMNREPSLHPPGSHNVQAVEAIAAGEIGEILCGVVRHGRDRS